jgi:hypothetical protein
MSNLCNALQFLVRRRKFNNSTRDAGSSRATRIGFSPVAAGQAFGFAASMAALPTVWLISLACSASARGGCLRGGDEFLERLAGLLEARFRHRSHILGYPELVSHVVAHGAFLCIGRDCFRIPLGAAPGRMQHRGFPIVNA